MWSYSRSSCLHTFTQVAAFGGGIVPQLNNLSHNPVVAPECTTLEEDDFVAPGGTYEEEIDTNGLRRPWTAAGVPSQTKDCQGDSNTTFGFRIEN